MDVELAARCRRGITVAIAALSLAGTRAAAQITTPSVEQPSGRWVLVSAVGYGGIGTLAGVVAAAAIGSDAFIIDGAQLATIGTGAVLGALAGATIGTEARQSMRNGEPLGGVSRKALELGAVMAGATAGAILSTPIVMGHQINADTEVFSAFTASGAILGALYADRHRQELESIRLSIAPVHVPRAGYGLRVAVGF